LIDLGCGFNEAGQSQVLTWQTGYRAAVGLHRGYPVHYADEFSAEKVLNRCEADAALVVGGGANVLSEPAQRHLRKIPRITLSPGISGTPEPSQVTLFTSIPGIDAPGTVFRSDGVAMPLRPAFSPSFPHADAVVNLLIDALGPRGRG
jgi:formylmethanofuran dehydrogenase subunit B